MYWHICLCLFLYVGSIPAVFRSGRSIQYVWHLCAWCNIDNHIIIIIIVIIIISGGGGGISVIQRRWENSDFWWCDGQPWFVQVRNSAISTSGNSIYAIRTFFAKLSKQYFASSLRLACLKQIISNDVYLL